MKMIFYRKGVLVTVFAIFLGLLICGYKLYKTKMELLSLQLQNHILHSKMEEELSKMAKKDCFIKAETTKIIYSVSSGCCTASSEIKIYRNHIVWEYNERINKLALRDSCKYDEICFLSLIKELSEIHFTVIKSPNIICGHAGYAYSFEINSQCYLSYSSSYMFSENYCQVKNIIQHFIEKHKTKAQILFEKYSKMPHEHALRGEFLILPKELQKYQVK